MDSTNRRHPKPTPFIAAAATKLHHHPTPDPIAPTSTIHSISHRFSKLYANHQKLASKSVNPPSAHPKSNPHSDARSHEKTLAVSPVLDQSCAALTKSKSQHERITSVVEKENFVQKSKAVLKVEYKKSTGKDPKKPAIDVKKASQLMSRSLDSDRIRGLQKGVEGRRSSALQSGERRKSLCSTYVELADIISCSGVKVLAVDMPPFMQIHAVNCARKTHDSLEKFTSKTLAFTLKTEFDAAYGPAWHCIVGASFGSFVTHSVGGFMYFSMDHKIYVLLFKTAVQKAYSN